LKIYEEALFDLDKANNLEPDDAFTLKERGEVKLKLNDYEGAMLDLDKANHLTPNDASILKAREDVKLKLNNYEVQHCWTWIKLMFFNQMMNLPLAI
jgi:tetratricopeptide (TPR) repeat protein